MGLSQWADNLEEGLNEWKEQEECIFGGEGQEAGVEVQMLMESFNTFSPISFPSHCTRRLTQYVIVTVCLKAGLETMSWNKVSIC